MRAIFLVALVCVPGLAACDDVAGPGSTSRRAFLSNIQVPTTAKATDTIRVSFNYIFPGCADTLERIEVKPGLDSLTFVVWGRAGNPVCPLAKDIYFRPPTFIYLAAPPRDATYAVVFHQPVGDSVRVVAAP